MNSSGSSPLLVFKKTFKAYENLEVAEVEKHWKGVKNVMKEVDNRNFYIRWQTH